MLRCFLLRSIGTVDESSVRTYCLDKEIECGDFIKIIVTTELLYEHFQLFDVFDTG